MTEDKMVGWHHQLNGQEFEQDLADGEGQGSLACCSPWDCKELDMTEQLSLHFISFIGRTDAEGEVPVLWLPDVKS